MPHRGTIAWVTTDSCWQARANNHSANYRSAAQAHFVVSTLPSSCLKDTLCLACGITCGRGNQQLCTTVAVNALWPSHCCWSVQKRTKASHAIVKTGAIRNFNPRLFVLRSCLHLGAHRRTRASKPGEAKPSKQSASQRANHAPSAARDSGSLPGDMLRHETNHAGQSLVHVAPLAGQSDTERHSGPRSRQQISEHL